MGTRKEIFYLLQLLGAFALLSYWQGHWALAALAGLILLPGFFLRPYRQAVIRRWEAFGRLLQKVVSPIVLSLVYWAFVVPWGLLGRLMGRDELGLRPPASGKKSFFHDAPREYGPKDFERMG